VFLPLIACACFGASSIFPTLHQTLEAAGMTLAQQVPRAV
jgi:hypothetical protein